MSNWRALADKALGKTESENTRDNSNASPPSGPFVPTVPSVPPLDPVRALKAWRSSLSAIDIDTPRHDLTRLRWGQLIENANWLMEHFGTQAARDGWSEADLFSVMPGRDGWGGIADRLCGSRSLVMSADRAAWRRVINGEPESYARGMGDLVKHSTLWT